MVIVSQPLHRTDSGSSQNKRNCVNCVVLHPVFAPSLDTGWGGDQREVKFKSSGARLRLLSSHPPNSCAVWPEASDSSLRARGRPERGLRSTAVCDTCEPRAGRAAVRRWNDAMGYGGRPTDISQTNRLQGRVQHLQNTIISFLAER